MELSVKNVTTVFMDCLFKEGENTDDPAIAKGITLNIGFNKDRLKKNDENITSMLKQLPIGFYKNSGGGMTFLDACNNAEGNQWTGSHEIMEQLFCLGLASEKAYYLLSRKMWCSLPGGMPYIVVKD